MHIVLRSADIAELVESRPGAVFAYPTETFYGLGCKLSDTEAIERIIKIKGRDAAKGMILLVANMHQAESISEITQKQAALLRLFWPAPLSVILKGRKGLNPLISPNGRIALRISPNEKVLELTEIIGPTVSTSANPSGKNPASTVKEVIEYGLEIDAILDGGSTPGGLPSTLVDITGHEPVCMRKGVIPFETVMQRWHEVEAKCSAKG